VPPLPLGEGWGEGLLLNLMTLPPEGGLGPCSPPSGGWGGGAEPLYDHALPGIQVAQGNVQNDNGEVIQFT